MPADDSVPPQQITEFPGRFHMIHRAAWGKDAKSLIVNRNETVSHIGLIENF